MQRIFSTPEYDEAMSVALAAAHDDGEKAGFTMGQDFAQKNIDPSLFPFLKVDTEAIYDEAVNKYATFSHPVVEKVNEVVAADEGLHLLKLYLEPARPTSGAGPSGHGGGSSEAQT